MAQSTKFSGWTNTQVYTAIFVVLILGGIGGYLLHSSSSSQPSSGSQSAPVSPPPSGMANMQEQSWEAQTRPLLDRLNSNPHDVAAMVELGNLSFDSSQWSAAIGYYTRALNETPHNPDVRTDMGIAYYYTGDADRALKEFDQALKDDPRHAQTLYNIGVVKLGGKNDAKGAVAAWETLLKIAPSYPERAKVESMITDARAKIK